MEDYSSSIEDQPNEVIVRYIHFLGGFPEFRRINPRMMEIYDYVSPQKLKIYCKGGHLDLVKYAIFKEEEILGKPFVYFWRTDENTRIDPIRININRTLEEVLDHAVMGGHLDVVKFFDERRIGFTSKTLFDAARGGNHKMIEMIRNTGKLRPATPADIVRGNLNSRRVFQGEHILELFYEPFNQNDAENSILNGAANSGNVDLVKTAIDNGAENYCGGLENAASHGHTEVFSYLLWTARNVFGEPEYEEFFKCAVKSGSIDIIRLIMTRVPTLLDKTEMSGDYAILCYAVMYGNVELVNLVLKSPANYCSGRRNLYQICESLRISISEGDYDITNMVLDHTKGIKNKIDLDFYENLCQMFGFYKTPPFCRFFVRSWKSILQGY